MSNVRLPGTNMEQGLENPRQNIKRYPVLGCISLSIAIFQIAGRWWLHNHGPSGHIGALVIGESFLLLSAFFGAVGVLCAIGSVVRRERYMLLGIAGAIAIIIELHTLRQLF
jgi:hypothetical protein